MAEEAEAGDVGGSGGSCREGGPGGIGVEAQHRRHRGGGHVGWGHAPLDSGGHDAGAEGLGEHEHLPGAQAGVGEQAIGVGLADDSQAVLGLGVVDRMAPDDGEPGLGGHVAGAGQHLSQEVHRQLVHVPGHQVERHERTAAHGVHVGDGVHRSDAAPGAGVVDDRGEEVGREYERPVDVEAPHPGVVAGGGSDEEPVVVDRSQLADHLAEEPRRQLAGAPGAVAVLGEPLACGRGLGH